MACYTNVTNGMCAVTTNTTAKTTNVDNTIAGLLKRIDTYQRNAITNNALTNCDNCVINTMFNTRPINIFCGCTQFTITAEGVEYTYFRVEEVRGTDTVVLRLLAEDAEGTITCTTNTFVMKIDCICPVKCNPAINCTLACFTA